MNNITVENANILNIKIFKKILFTALFLNCKYYFV